MQGDPFRGRPAQPVLRPLPLPQLPPGPRWKDEIHIARAVINGEIEKTPKANVYVDQRAS